LHRTLKRSTLNSLEDKRPQECWHHAPRAVATPADDPIFAPVERHKRAAIEYAVGISGSVANGEQGQHAAEATTHEACYVKFNAALGLIRTIRRQ